jgi:hypothetical protein
MDPVYAPHTVTLKNSTFSQQTLCISFINSHHFPKQHKYETVFYLRQELNSYILLKRISSFKGLNIEVHYLKNKGHGKYVYILRKTTGSVGIPGMQL